MEAPAIFGGNRYLVPFNRGIATTSVRTGLAMTGNLEQSDKHQFVIRGKLSKSVFSSRGAGKEDRGNGTRDRTIFYWERFIHKLFK